MDLIALQGIIADSGVKRSHLAKICGLSRQGFYDKLNGKYMFTVDEVKILKNVLHLTLKQVDDIFLS